MKGFVLAAMLAALLVASALLGGAFFYALQEERIGRNGTAAVRALAAAEAGAGLAMDGWSAAREGAVLPGDSLRLEPVLAQGAGRATVTLTPLGETVVLLRSQGEDATGTARRDVAVLVRLRAPPIATEAAAVSGPPADVSLAAAVDGDDHPPDGWHCGAPAPVAPLAALQDSSWSDWDSLAARAAAGSRLPDRSTPAVLVDGDFTVIGGSGVGILMVSGDVRIDGGAMLTGMLLVRGRLTFTGAGGRIVGAVRAGSIGVDPSALSGGPVVEWSSCAVVRARRALAVPTPLPGWFWADLDGGW